jgi:multisubunit Na+/H+ antiporter MnhB subunit
MPIVGFTILVLLVLLLIWLYTVVAKIPGETARERNHPQAEAINVLGWIGLLLGVAPWLVALVWAYIRTTDGDAEPVFARVSGQENDNAQTGGD